MSNIKLAISEIRKSISHADNIMNDLWQVMMNRSANINQKYIVHESDLQFVLADILKSIGRQLPVLLEMLGLNESRKSFNDLWSKFDDKELKEYKEWHDCEGDYVISEPLDLCRQFFDIVEAPYQDETSSVIEASFELLDHIFESGEEIINAVHPMPEKELHIQQPTNSHLNNTFPSFVKKVVIPKPIVCFIPDGGIADLQVAVEYKFVSSEDELKVAIHGLTEDISAYSGSRDWTMFYTLIYQTKHHGTQKQIKNALKKSGNADRWKAFLITGSGGRKKRKRSNTKKND